MYQLVNEMANRVIGGEPVITKGQYIDLIEQYIGLVIPEPDENEVAEMKARVNQDAGMETAAGPGVQTPIGGMPVA